MAYLQSERAGIGENAVTVWDIEHRRRLSPVKFVNCTFVGFVGMDTERLFAADSNTISAWKWSDVIAELMAGG